MRCLCGRVSEREGEWEREAGGGGWERGVEVVNLTSFPTLPSLLSSLPLPPSPPHPCTLHLSYLHSHALSTTPSLSLSLSFGCLFTGRPEWVRERGSPRGWAVPAELRERERERVTAVPSHLRHLRGLSRSPSRPLAASHAASVLRAMLARVQALLNT
jgi:hypothetical protein